MQRRQVPQPVHVDLFLIERAQAGDLVLGHEAVGDDFPSDPSRQARFITDERRVVGGDADPAVALS